MKDNISPEEKLLGLIKGGKKASGKESSSFSNNPGVVLKGPGGFNIQKYFSFVFIQKIINVLMFIALFYFTGTFVYPWFSEKEIKLPVILPEGRQKDIVENLEKPKSFEYYQDAGRVQGFFARPLVSQPQGPSVVAGAELLKDFALVGIISGDNPQAVIEDKKNQKTYYLKKGQFMGEFQVEQIEAGKIVLSYENQNYELHM